MKAREVYLEMIRLIIENCCLLLSCVVSINDAFPTGKVECTASSLSPAKNRTDPYSTRPKSKSSCIIALSAVAVSAAPSCTERRYGNFSKIGHSQIWAHRMGLYPRELMPLVLPS